MTRTFFLYVRDEKTGKTYTFDAYIEEDESFLDLYVGNTNLDACIHIVIGQDEEASLADLSHRPKCEVAGNLEEAIGTDVMLKGSLKYVIQAFPHIKRVSLQDLAKKKNTNVLLTPKRLLLGKPGWYEERFGAKPTVKTQAVKGWLKKQHYLALDTTDISKSSWGSIKDIQTLSNDHVKLLGTTWDIPYSTIHEYPVSIKIKDLDHNQQMGGGCSWHTKAKRRKRQHNRVQGQIGLITQMHFMKRHDIK
jgi:RNAse (barnase) inhibitor barstar